VTNNSTTTLQLLVHAVHHRQLPGAALRHRRRHRERGPRNTRHHVAKSWGAPGMNGINNMGAYELNALGERFMANTTR